jgi:outer membrane immunogenic protein
MYTKSAAAAALGLVALISINSSECLAAAAPSRPWMGFYAGLSVGQRWDRADWTTNGFTQPGFPFGTLGFFDNDASFGAARGRLGGYIGYNYQIDEKWLVGLEADFGDAFNNGRSIVGIPGSGIGNALFAGGNLSQTTVEMSWDGSVRGRGGYLVTPNIHLFGTAGVAFQHIKETIFCSGANSVPQGCAGGVVFPAPDVTDSVEKTLVGWTVGGGIEAAVWQNWLLRAEYRYADFDSFDHLFNFGTANNTNSPGVSTRFATHTMSVGLAYKFGAPMASEAYVSMPVKARPIAPSWTGFYVGLALGGRRTNADWTTTSVVGGPPFANNEALLDSTAFRYGGYAGFNYQIGRIVAGIEAGLGDTSKSSRSTSGGVPGLGNFFFAPAPDGVTVASKWDANIVGRVGYLVAPDVLLYGVGGVAFQRVDLHAVCTAASFLCLSDLDESVSATRTGSVVGVGIEAMFAPGWLVRLDYRYADFGTIEHAFFVSDPISSMTTSTAIRTQTATFGIAYKFGPHG